MLAELTAAFPGSRLRAEADTIVGPLQHAGLFHSLRLRFEPLLEVFLEVPPLDGFELEIQAGDRWFGDTEIGDEHVDRSYFIRTNDDELAKVWLDEPARAVLRALSAGIAARNHAEVERVRELRRIDPGDLSTGKVLKAWPIEMRKRQLSMTGGSRYSSTEAVLEAIEVACTIAGSAGRWAAKVAAMAPLTGARVKSVVDRIALGERALLLEQQRADVDVRYLREDDRLMTRVSTPRRNESEATWTARPGKTLPEPVLAPLFGHKDRPTSVVASSTEISVWFTGAVLDPEVIALATRTVAQLASDAGTPEGPYR